MVIRRSSSREVAGLLQDLQAGDEVARETAVARLAVIGTRAVEGLVRVATSDAAPAVRAAAFAALESIDDPRAIDPAFAALDEHDGALVLPAAAVLRRALDSSRGTEVLDRLAAVALDSHRADRPRLAAIEALQGLPPKLVAPVWKKLKHDSSPAVRGAVADTGPMSEIDPGVALERAAGGELPDDPDTIRRWLTAAAGQASLPVLHRLVTAIRSREQATGDPARRAAWMTSRAAVHLALAERGSRVALYDLREAIEGAPAAPVEMLAAVETIGDASCLEPIAAAYARLAAPAARPASGPSPDADASAWWRQHLGTAFRVIAAREKLTERLPVVRRIRSRWPEAAADLLGPARR